MLPQTHPTAWNPLFHAWESLLKAQAEQPAIGAAEVAPEALLALQQRYTQLATTLLQSFINREPGARGESVMTPEPGDRRFSGTEWNAYPYFDLLKQSYLLGAQFWREWSELVPAADEHKQRLQFWTRQMVDALAPSNFLPTNPEAIREALASEGESVQRGVANLLHDMQQGRIAMSDEQAFAVGKNLAVTPGAVVYRNALIELIQYQPQTQQVYERPLLMVPPCINKYYILDLQAHNSFVRYAVEQGHTVFMISWRNIPPELGSLTWDDYLDDGVLQAIKVVQAITRRERINVLGFCVGGTLLACALAVLAARGEERVASVTLLTSMLDFSAPGDIGVYLDPAQLDARAPALEAGGRLHGSELAGAFASLRSNELVWFFVVNNYLRGRAPAAFDLLYWNGDGANLPGPMYLYYVREMYVANRLREANALTMCGAPIDLQRITIPAYVLAAREDHIVPWRSAYKTTGLLRGEVRFVLGASGHIAGVINPAAKGKRNYWVHSRNEADADVWLERALSHPGSWWTDWCDWLARRSGDKVPAPKRLGSQTFRQFGPAPGSYVLEKV